MAFFGMEGKDLKVASITAVFALIGTLGASMIGYLMKKDEIGIKTVELRMLEAQKEREMDLVMLQVALRVLSGEPEQLQSLRKWAVSVINKVASVPIPDEARDQLMRVSLPEIKAEKKAKAE